MSTDDQQRDLQLDALLRYGVQEDRIFTDNASGAQTTGRAGFRMAMQAMRPGDALVVWKLDRLGRNLSELIQTAEHLRQRQADLISLTESIDTETAAGKMMFHMIGMFAQLERDMISERTKAGLAAARARGKAPGRPTVMQPEVRAQVIKYLGEGRSFEAIAPLVGVSKSSLYNYADDLRAELAVIEADKLGSNQDAARGATKEDGDAGV